jgi:hypothetical protein
LVKQESFVVDLVDLIEKLKCESDHEARNALALKLAESKEPAVLEVLIGLIDQPRLVNYRATMVHCLQNFDCRPYFTKLVSLVITGSWEVAHEAFDALNSIVELSDDQASAGFDLLSEAAGNSASEKWRAALISDLLSMFE